MPWSKDNPPSVAKNWTEAEQARCIKVANAILREGGSEESAIFGCIRAAGKTKHPGGKQDAKGGLELEPVTAEELSEYGNHALFANTEPGSLLRFKGAILCTIGENANRDWIDESGIKELAATMPFRAIDDEHIADRVIGFFVNPRAEDNSTKLVTDGLLHADRFPEIVAQVQNGTKKLSVEAVAQKAVCSVCEGEFVSVKGYCDHLKDKPAHGAVRKLYGLKARGGATVFHPAWDTSFDANGFVMIASQVEFEKPKESNPKWVTNLIAKVENLISRLQPVSEDNIEGGVTMSEINVDELNLEELGLVQASELETLKVDLEARLAEKDTDAEKLKIGFARVLEMGYEVGQLEILAEMSEDAYQLLKAQQKPKEEVVIEGAEEEPAEGDTPGRLQGAVLEAGDDSADTPLTWNTYSGILKLGGE